MRWDRQKVTDEQIEEALRKTKGLITMAARWIGQTYGIPITHGAISLRVASSEHLRQVRRIVYGLLKIQRGNCAPWFQVVNLAWATVPWDAEILCRDEEYVILKVTKEWCIQEARQGRDVTSGSFEDS